jgi:hypothetical protein
LAPPRARPSPPSSLLLTIPRSGRRQSPTRLHDSSRMRKGASDAPDRYRGKAAWSNTYGMRAPSAPNVKGTDRGPGLGPHRPGAGWSWWMKRGPGHCGRAQSVYGGASAGGSSTRSQGLGEPDSSGTRQDHARLLDAWKSRMHLQPTKSTSCTKCAATPARPFATMRFC